MSRFKYTMALYFLRHWADQTQIGLNKNGFNSSETNRNCHWVNITTCSYALSLLSIHRVRFGEHHPRRAGKWILFYKLYLHFSVIFLSLGFQSSFLLQVMTNSFCTKSKRKFPLVGKILRPSKFLVHKRLPVAKGKRLSKFRALLQRYHHL